MICMKTYKREQDLKAHKTKTGHNINKKRKSTTTTKKDAILENPGKAKGNTSSTAESDVWRHTDT